MLIPDIPRPTFVDYAMVWFMDYIYFVMNEKLVYSVPDLNITSLQESYENDKLDTSDDTFGKYSYMNDPFEPMSATY